MMRMCYPKLIRLEMNLPMREEEEVEEEEAEEEEEAVVDQTERKEVKVFKLNKPKTDKLFSLLIYLAKVVFRILFI